MVNLALKPHYFHPEDMGSDRQRRCHRCSADIYTEEQYFRSVSVLCNVSVLEQFGKKYI